MTKKAKIIVNTISILGLLMSLIILLVGINMALTDPSGLLYPYTFIILLPLLAIVSFVFIILLKNWARILFLFVSFAFVYLDIITIVNSIKGIIIGSPSAVLKLILTGALLVGNLLFLYLLFLYKPVKVLFKKSKKTKK